METRITNGLPVAARAVLFFVVALLLLPRAGFAQFYNAATGTEYTYPGGGIVNNTSHSHTYTFSHIAWMSNVAGWPIPAGPPYTPAPPGPEPLTDLTVHSWDDPGSPSGFAYISSATGSGTPGTVYDQGFIMYPPGTQDIEMSLQQDENGFAMYPYGTNAAWYVVVSYYCPMGMFGPGHYVDVFLWNPPPPYGTGGLTPVSTTQLSTIGSYTQIRQDGHNSYGFCIAFEDPANGIDFVYGFMNKSIPGVSMSPVYTLPGTMGETHPDVAFTHTSAGLNVQFTYYKLVNAQAQITESTIPMVLGPPWPVAVPAPVINDINTIIWAYASVPNLQLRMDAPDHLPTDNWAYTYVTPGPGAPFPSSNDIYVRFNNGGVFTTYVLTNGSMGPAASNHFPNFRPEATFDNNTSLLNVEWYTQCHPGGFFAPNVGGYAGLQINQAGGVTSALDYLQVGEAASLSNTQASPTPTISSSKQNDRTDYQYAVFANVNTTGPGNVMQVKDRLWGSPTFRPGAGAGGASYYTGTTAVSTPATDDNSVFAYPNPFTDRVNLSVSPALQDKTLTVTVEDITGKVAGTYSGTLSAINGALANLSTSLANGTYVLKVQSQENNFDKVLKIQKLASQ